MSVRGESPDAHTSKGENMIARILAVCLFVGFVIVPVVVPPMLKLAETFSKVLGN